MVPFENGPPHQTCACTRCAFFAWFGLFFYLVKLVKQTCFTNAAGGGKLEMAVAKSYCWSILKRIISTRCTGSRWKRKLLINDRCFISSINVWLPTLGTRLKKSMSIAALLVLFNWSALGVTSGTRVDRCCKQKANSYLGQCNAQKTHKRQNWVTEMGETRHSQRQNNNGV